MSEAIGALILGLVVLTGGAEALVRGASRLAASLGVSPLVVGLTVVAVGTSMPELAVSVAAAWAGNTEIALGNVVGSNICNVGLVLGLSALVFPVAIERDVFRYLPPMIAASLALPALAVNGRIGRVDGALLAIAFAVFTWWMVRRHDRSMADPVVGDDLAAPHPDFFGRRAGQLLMIAAGIGLLVGGSKAVIFGAVRLAEIVGLSHRVVGLTVVALNTSLPELATTMVATIRRNTEIGIGNIVGSNIANILLVLGTTALVRPVASELTGPRVADMAVMIAFAVLLVGFARVGQGVGRGRGAVLVAGYAVYIAFLIA
ncbi:MAG: calcium/sodium antiporter [Deltaproteobacteria bacterium]|nr:calcium/sodium antiporter [Deltaproteobacteria bacterium]